MVNPNDWQEIDDGAFNGVKKFIRATDDDHGTVQVRYEGGRDVAGIVEANKRSQVDNLNTRMGDMAKVASIPTTVMYEWLSKFGVNAWNPAHQAAVVKLLNSSDYRYLKVRDIII